MDTSIDTSMSPDILSLAAQLSDQELLARVKLLTHQEREVTAALIAHLAVLDERRLYLAEGCSSLFTYCTQVLHLSEHAAYGRIEAARAARRFPVVLELLFDGSVNLTTVGLLAPHLTDENHHELLEAARHKSKRQVEELGARLRPQPPVPSAIRRLPTAGHAPTPAPLTDAGTSSWSGSDLVDLEFSNLQPGSPGYAHPLAAATATSPAAPPPARPAVVTPLAPERYKVQFTASAQTHAKLRLAQDLLRHQIPDGDLGQIIDRALTALLKDLAKRKVAATDRPRGSRDRGNHGSVQASRHIPAEVRRTVWARDGGRCAFVATNGRRCTERAFLEFHHVVPYGAGGEATVDNIELRCRAHNGYEAELYFGSRAAPWGSRTLAVKEAPATYWHSPTYWAAEQGPMRLRLRMTSSTRSSPSSSQTPTAVNPDPLEARESE